MIFNLHIKSQFGPEAVRTLLIQSELTLRPGELRQLQPWVQATLETPSGWAPARHPLQERVPWPPPAVSRVPLCEDTRTETDNNSFNPQA